jgi:hypothetical protein
VRKFSPLYLLALAPFVACGTKPGTDEGEDTGSVIDPSTVDQDADGYTADVDCDDSDADTYPDAPELCDNVDNNCDGFVDEDKFEMYLDADLDGFGDPAAAASDCKLLDGYVENSSDCNDADPDVHPSATEICDGVDNDCDTGTTEEGLVLRTVGGVSSDASALFQGSASAAAQVTLNGANETYSFCDGTYYVNIDIGGVGVTLESRSGNAGDVTLDGAGQGAVVEAIGAGLDTSLFDLRIQNGGNSFQADFGLDLAGGIGCFGYDGGFDTGNPTSALMTLAGLEVVENSADVGGGIFGLMCDVTLSDTLVKDNTASSTAAGIYLGLGEADFSDVQVRNHTTTGNAAGILFENWSSDEVRNSTFQNVQVEDNSSSSSNEGSAIDVDGHNLIWTSTGAGLSSLLGNSDSDDESAAMSFDGDLTVQGVDFGEDGGANDNSKYDLYQGYPADSYYVAGNNASFNCTPTNGCGSPVQYNLGDYTQSSSAQSGFYGDVVYVDTRATVDSFSVGLQNASCTSNRALIFERNSVANGASQSWEVIWTNYSSTANNGFMESGTVGRVLEVGKYYAFVLGFDCSGSFGGLHLDTSASSGVNVGIGSSKGNVTKSGTFSALYPGSTLTMTYASGVDKYDVELFITEL